MDPIRRSSGVGLFHNLVHRRAVGADHRITAVACRREQAEFWKGPLQPSGLPHGAFHGAPVFCGVLRGARTGAVVNLNHITRGVNAHDWAGVWLAAIGIAIAVTLWLLATRFTLRFPRVLQMAGRSLVGWMMAGMERWRPSAEYSEKDFAD